jgi:hypothetical protein
MRQCLRIVVFLLLSANTVFAESVVLKSGMVIQGEVVEKTDEHIKINTGSSVLKIPFKRMDEKFAAAYRALPEKTVEIQEVLLYKGQKISREDVQGEEVLKAILAKYKEMSSFQCNGGGITNTNYGSSLSSGYKYITIKFQRPGFYLIVEKTSAPKSVEEIRAAWHSGEGHFYYKNKAKKYFQLPNAILARMGVGYINILYDFFIGCTDECALLKTFSYFGNATFGGEHCYLFKQDVNSGSYMIWISKSNHLILKIDYEFSGHSDEFFARGIDIEAINSIFPVLKMELSAENQKIARQAIKDIHAIRWGLEAKTYVEVTFENIKINEELKPKDFQYPYPEDTAFESEEDFKKRFEKK